MSSGRRRSTPCPYSAVVLANERCVCTTPLGRPVVPPLNSQIAGIVAMRVERVERVRLRMQARVENASLSTEYSRGARGRPSDASSNRSARAAGTNAAVARVYSKK